jgi:hypothetical protein
MAEAGQKKKKKKKKKNVKQLKCQTELQSSRLFDFSLENI